MDKQLFKKRAVSVFYPNRCRFCTRVIDIRKAVCPECEDSKNEITGEICMACGCMKKDCTCRGKKHFYVAVAAPYYYDGAAGKAIKLLKFQNRKECADPLFEDMASCLLTRFSGYTFDAVTFVPSSKKEKRSRGFNQAEILAKGVAELSNIPFWEALVKDFETAPQHSLPENERTGNLLGVFNIKDGITLSGKRILLCDDVKTTGSTLNECAKTLLIGGASEVFCLTAAITKNQITNKN